MSFSALSYQMVVCILCQVLPYHLNQRQMVQCFVKRSRVTWDSKAICHMIRCPVNVMMSLCTSAEVEFCHYMLNVISMDYVNLNLSTWCYIVPCEVKLSHIIKGCPMISQFTVCQIWWFYPVLRCPKWLRHCIMKPHRVFFTRFLTLFFQVHGASYHKLLPVFVSI